MAFLRIDWNGHGYESFVTDANPARHRISSTTAAPDPDAWQRIAFGWDESTGVRLHVNSRAVGREDAPADPDARLDQFGLAGRTSSPTRVPRTDDRTVVNEWVRTR